MKKILGLLIALMLLTSLAHAEFLNICMPIGTDHWAFMYATYQDSELVGNSNPIPNGKHESMGKFLLGRGLTDRLDIIWEYESSSSNSTSVIKSGLGAQFKYALFREAPLDQFVSDLSMAQYSSFSLSTFAGYKSVAANLTTLGSVSGSQLYAGLAWSKIIAPMVPYCAATYRYTSYGSSATFNQIDATVG